MTTARQKIFSYINKRRSVTAAEIARDLRMTPANARHHLAQLLKNGQIEMVGKRSVGKLGGRPVNIYAVSRKLLGDGLPTLSHHLLDEMLGSVNAPQRISLLQKLGQRLASPLTSGTSTSLSTGTGSTSPMLRLTDTVKRLNELGYESRWEAHASGPRIILGHCPYAAIIKEHPELCEMDAALLTECLAQRVEQTAKLEGTDSGRPYCVFAVG
jgi:predicted ArsR family transcriptional regulator